MSRTRSDWLDENGRYPQEPAENREHCLVGKYVGLHDAYLSVAEALKHGGIGNNTDVNIHWVDSEELTEENIAERMKGSTAF